MLTVILAIIAALLVSLLLFYGREAPSEPVAQTPSPAEESQILAQLTPMPASDATLAAESQTLSTVSKTSAQSNATTLSNQAKTGVLLQTQQTQLQTQ